MERTGGCEKTGIVMKDEGGIVSDKVLWPLGSDSVAEQQFCRRLHVPRFRRQRHYYCVLQRGKDVILRQEILVAQLLHLI